MILAPAPTPSRASATLRSSGLVFSVTMLALCLPSVAINHPNREIPDRNCLRSEEHTSELQSPMRISYAVFCLKKKTPVKYYTYDLERQDASTIHSTIKRQHTHMTTIHDDNTSIPHFTI